MKRSSFIKRASLATLGLTLFPSIAFTDNSYEAYLRWFKNEFHYFKYEPIHPDTTYHGIPLEDDMQAFREMSKAIVDYLEKGIRSDEYSDWFIKHDIDNKSYADIILENKTSYLRNHKKLLKEYKIITFEEWKKAKL